MGVRGDLTIDNHRFEDRGGPVIMLLNRHRIAKLIELTDLERRLDGARAAVA
jgi:hypothetical protein